MVTGDDLTLGGGRAMQYTDHVLYKCSHETYNLINQCHPSKFNKKDIARHIKKCVCIREFTYTAE